MKKITKLLIFALAFVCVATFGTTAEAKASKVSVTNKKSVQTICRGAENKVVTMKYKVSGKMKAKSVKVTSSNKKVVAVQSGYTNSAAKLVAKKAGKATITIKADSKKATVKVVVKQNVTKITSSVKKAIASNAGVYTIQKGKKYTISNKFSGKKPTSKSVSYQSSKKSVVTVSSKGVLTAKKPGTATITVKAKDKGKVKTTFKVIVTKKIKKKTKNVEVVADETLLKVGATTTVSATVDKKATLQKVAYKSADTKVATVDSLTGKVKAVAPGKVKITAYAMDGSNKKATVEITVKAEANGVKFVTAPAKVYVGTTTTLVAKTTNDAYDGTVQYSIDKASQSVATITTDGKLTAKARGTVTVTATTVNGKVVTTKVTVVDKVVTKITPDAKEVQVSVTFTGDKNKVKADVEEALKLAKVEAGSSKSITINGKDYVATYKDGVLMIGDKTVDKFVATEATISMTIGTKMNDFVKALEVAQFANKTYDYAVTVGGVEIKKLTVGMPYMTVNAGGKDYQAYAEKGVLYIVGDKTADETVQKLAAEAGTKAVVQNN